MIKQPSEENNSLEEVRSSEKKGKNFRLSWNSTHDLRLSELVQEHGEMNWKRVAQGMCERFFLPFTGKNCRERWINSKKSGINRLPLTEKEGIELLIYHQIYGNNWALIAKHFVARNPSCLKNNLYSLIKKTVRQIDHQGKGERIKIRSLSQFLSFYYIASMLAISSVSEEKKSIKDKEQLEVSIPKHLEEYLKSKNLSDSACITYLRGLIKGCSQLDSKLADGLSLLDLNSLGKVIKKSISILSEVTLGEDKMDQVIEESLSKAIGLPESQDNLVPPTIPTIPSVLPSLPKLSPFIFDPAYRQSMYRNVAFPPYPYLIPPQFQSISQISIFQCPQYPGANPWSRQHPFFHYHT